MKPSLLVGDLYIGIGKTAFTVGKPQVGRVEGLLHVRKGRIRVWYVSQVDIAHQDDGERIAVQTEGGTSRSPIFDD